MTTRFYLPRAATEVPFSPTPSADWHDTSILVRAIMKTSPEAIDTLGSVTFTDVDNTNRNVLYRQYLSDEIASGQSLASAVTLSYQIQASEVSNSSNLFLAAYAVVIASDGATVRRYYLTLTRDNLELATTATNRRYTISGSVGGYTTQPGDRLLLELGYGGDPSTGTHSGSLVLGGQGASDLPANDTDTTSLSKNPWFEISDTLTFVSPSTGNRRRRSIICGSRS